MNQGVPHLDVLDDLLAQIWEQGPDAQLRQQLNQLLNANPRAQQRYVALQSLHTDLLDPSGPLGQMQQSELVTQATAVAQDVEPDWMTQSFARQDVGIDKDTITPRELASLAGYMLGRALTSKFAYKTYAIAAMLLVAATLFIVFGNNDGPATDPLAGNVPADVTTGTPGASQTVVATLNAEHDAVWDRRPGQDLYAGQRFTLTDGFAEITTTRGAVAILEAPATIELLDNNAIHLHAGKLVGICETDASKGFLVRTAHMDVTDLGTRFGVDASQDGNTEVHVFEGEVEAALPKLDGEDRVHQRFVAGQAARVQSEAEGLVAIEQDRGRFASALASLSVPLPRGASDAGVAALTGDLVWSPASPYLDNPRLKWRADDRVVVIEELPAYRLTADTPVTVLGPGSTDGMTQIPQDRAIPVGTTVRTYILVFCPETSDQRVHAMGSATFEGEVLGIATEVGQAQAFMRSVGDQARLVPVPSGSSNWADVIDPQFTPDAVTLQDNKRTVDFALSGGAGGTDAIRVFVRIPDE